MSDFGDLRSAVEMKSDGLIKDALNLFTGDKDVALRYVIDKLGYCPANLWRAFKPGIHTGSSYDAPTYPGALTGVSAVVYIGGAPVELLAYSASIYYEAMDQCIMHWRQVVLNEYKHLPFSYDLEQIMNVRRSDEHHKNATINEIRKNIPDNIEHIYHYLRSITVSDHTHALSSIMKAMEHKFTQEHIRADISRMIIRQGVEYGQVRRP